MIDYKKYPFLKPVKIEGNEEYEVSKESIEIIYNKYEWYKNHNYKLCCNRRQRPYSAGYCLSKGTEAKLLDVSADIITSISAFSNIDENKPLYKCYKEIYHSIGNIMPICEGGNLGGGNYKNGESSDHFLRKLDMIKNFFESKTTDKELPFKDYSNIGRNRKALIRYWISSELKDSKWEWKDFIRENYLQDFVDKDNNVIKLDFGQGKIETLEETIKIIIKRGYRIWNKGKEELSEDSLREIYNKMF